MISTLTSGPLATAFTVHVHALTSEFSDSGQSQNINYISSGKVRMICKLIVPDSSVYYAVTLVSSDAVWLLSHLTVKKGSWVRGMDCALSALVTQIVHTLQRKKKAFSSVAALRGCGIHFL